jgi:hypothetical protein
MATRMQQRRGTAAQWISTNSGNGPILNAGEIGFETDTNKFKIGDGTNHWINLDYFIDANSTVNPSFGTSIVFEGATADSYETTLQVTDPTADRTITLPNVTGTVITTGNLSDITDIGVFTSTITMEGSSADDFELTLSAGNPTADRTITFPDATGTVALTSDIAELSQDAIDTALTAGTGITKTYNDSANTLTIAVDTTTIQARVTDVSDTEIGYLNGVTSAIQTQLDAKSTESKTETLTNKSISLGSNTVTSTLAQLNSAVSDADVASLAGTETLTNKTLTSPVINTPTGITKTDVGLANVDNTTDANKPVSTATQTELNLKAPLASPTFTGTVTIPPGASISGFAPLADPAFTGTTTAVNLTISGDLTVNGTTTNINSTSLVVEDKNIILGDATTPTDTTADGGGITLKGATDKTFNWVDSTDAWTSSEHINLASGKSYYVNGTLLKDVTETLANKTLTSPVVSGLTLSDSGIVFEGATANDFETTLTVVDPTEDRILTLPNETGTLATQEYVDGSITNAEVEQSTLAGSGITWNVSTSQFDVNTSTIQARVADVSDTEIGYLNGVTSAIQTQLDAKIAKADINAKGVILVGTGTGTYAAQSVGTNGQVLAANSAQADGVEWITPSQGAAFSEMMLIGA